MPRWPENHIPTGDTTSNQRRAVHEARKRAKGYSSVTLWLSPEGRAALEWLKADFKPLSASKIVELLLPAYVKLMKDSEREKEEKPNSEGSSLT